MFKLFTLKTVQLVLLLLAIVIIGNWQLNSVNSATGADCGTLVGTCLNGAIPSKMPPCLPGELCTWTCSGGAVSTCQVVNNSQPAPSGVGSGTSLCGTPSQKCTGSGYAYKPGIRTLLKCSDLGLGTGFVKCNSITCDYNLFDCSGGDGQNQVNSVNDVAPKDPNDPKTPPKCKYIRGIDGNFNCDAAPACESGAVANYKPAGKCGTQSECSWSCVKKGFADAKCTTGDSYECWDKKRIITDWENYPENFKKDWYYPKCLKNGKLDNSCAVVIPNKYPKYDIWYARFSCGKNYKGEDIICLDCATPKCGDYATITAKSIIHELSIPIQSYEILSKKLLFDNRFPYPSLEYRNFRCERGEVVNTKFLVMRNGRLEEVDAGPFNYFEDLDEDGEDDDGNYDVVVGLKFACNVNGQDQQPNGFDHCNIKPVECFTRYAICGDGKVNTGEECDNGPLNGTDKVNCTKGCKIKVIKEPKEPKEPKCGQVANCDEAPACAEGSVLEDSVYFNDPPPGCTKDCSWTCQTKEGTKTKEIECTAQDKFKCAKLNVTSYLLKNGYYDLCFRNNQPSPKCSTPVVEDKPNTQYTWTCGNLNCNACMEPVCGEFAYSFGERKDLTDYNFLKFDEVKDAYNAQGFKKYYNRGEWPNKPLCEVGTPKLERVSFWDFVSNGTIIKDPGGAYLSPSDPFKTSSSSGKDHLWEYSYWTWVCESKCTQDGVEISKSASCVVNRSFCGDGEINKPYEQCEAHPLVPSVNFNCYQGLSKLVCLDGVDKYKGGRYGVFGECSSCQCTTGPLQDVKCRKDCGAQAESEADCSGSKFDPNTCACYECDEDTDCNLKPFKECRGNISLNHKNKCNKNTRKCELIPAEEVDCTLLPLQFGYKLKGSGDKKYQKCLPSRKTEYAIAGCTRTGRKTIPPQTPPPPIEPGGCDMDTFSKCVVGSCGAECAGNEKATCYFDVNNKEIKQATTGCYKGSKSCVADCVFGSCIQEEFCGDGKKQACEECDDGNKINDDDCDNNCKETLKCGWGHGLGISEKNWRLFWQDPYQDGDLVDSKFLCSNGKKVPVRCLDANNKLLPNCQPANEIVKRAWACSTSVICESTNIGCAYPNNTYLSGPLTNTNQYSNVFFNNLFLEGKCLEIFKDDWKYKNTIEYNWIGSDSKGIKKDVCKQMFCFGNEKPVNVMYHGWYYNSEDDKNLNPYWSWECLNESDGSYEECGAKEAGCAPHFMAGVTDERYVDSFVDDTFPTEGNPEGDEHGFKITRANFNKLFDANHLCFNGGQQVPIAANPKPTFNVNYLDRVTKGFYGNNIFEYYKQGGKDIEYQLQNDNQGRWLWTCEYGDDVETRKLSYPDYSYFADRPIRKNQVDTIDPANYCFMEELAQCAIPDSQYNNSKAINTVDWFNGALANQKGLVSLCSSGYVDTNTGPNFPGFKAGVRYETNANGETVAFYYCASDYRANSCAMPLLVNGDWTNRGKAQNCLAKSYEDPLCRIKLKGCNDTIQNYAGVDFKYRAKSCFNLRGQYVGGIMCNKVLCDDGLDVKNFKEDEELNNWTWQCGGEKCRAEGSLCKVPPAGGEYTPQEFDVFKENPLDARPLIKGCNKAPYAVEYHARLDGSGWDWTCGTEKCSAKCTGPDCPKPLEVNCLQSLARNTWLTGFNEKDSMINFSYEYIAKKEKAISLVTQVVAKLDNIVPIDDPFLVGVGRCTWKKGDDGKCYTYSDKTKKKYKAFDCKSRQGAIDSMVQTLRDGHCCSQGVDCNKPLGTYEYLSGFDPKLTLSEIMYRKDESKLQTLIDQVIKQFGGYEWDTPNVHAPLVGQCTWLEHWDQGNCYIYSYYYGRKVAPWPNDPVCGNSDDDSDNLQSLGDYNKYKHMRYEMKNSVLSKTYCCGFQ